MAIVYAHNAQGFFVGEADDYGGPMPHNCVSTAPEWISGFIPRWNGSAWEQVENHVGEKGYVGGKYTVVKTYGPLPEGWSVEYVDPRPPAEIRRAEIQRRLMVIDTAAARPMRAILAGTATDDDRVCLAALEAEAAELREEGRNG